MAPPKAPKIGRTAIDGYWSNNANLQLLIKQIPVLKDMLVIEAPRPVNKSENATTRDLCFNNFLMVREELLLVY